jgi:CHAT domain-containing protein
MAARQEALPTVPSSSFPSVDVLSEILDRRDRALVSYFIDNPWPVYDRSPRSVAFVLTPDSLRTVPLPHLTQDSVRRHVEAVSPLFTDWDPERANAMHFDLRPLHHLYEAIYAPVARHLRADRPLTIVPDGPLYRLPFSMLVESLPGGRFAPSEARFLLHERPTSLEIAASLVADTSRGPSNRSRFTPQVAAYGVSQFDTLGTVPSALHAALPEAAIDSSFAPSPLPGVERELRALASTVADTRIALNRTATEQSLRHDVRTAGILHLASHAFVHPSSPLQNALLLHPDSSETDPSNGVLFLHELHEHRSRIPLVVLSGCGTANGPLRGGEGMEGLQYAFRAMGARSTLSTLWPVSDAASVDLMRSFYRHLEEGLSKDRALQQAKLQYLTDHPQRSSPFFWAPPILYGTTTSLPLEPAWGMTSWGWAALGLSGVLLAGLLFWWRRERLPGPFCHLGLR